MQQKEMLMDKKRPTSVTLIGYSEIAISAILFILCLTFIVASHYLIKGFNIGEGMFIFVFPAFIFTTGLFTLQLKKMGRMLNLYLAAGSIFAGINFVLVSTLILFIPNRHPTLNEMRYYFIMIALGIAQLVIAPYLLYFFTRPKIKKEFK